MTEPIVIAEIGCNHTGSMEIAHKMIKLLGVFKYLDDKSQIDIVKFQKRTNNAPHPHPENSYGKTYGEHREALEFSVEQHKQLQIWCKEEGLIYSTSVWDMTAAKEIISISPKIIKIPSACNLDFEMLSYLCSEYNGEIHLSLGMTTQKEEERILKLFKYKHRLKDLVIYACTSGYPVPFKDVTLYEITRLKQKYEHKVKAIGFSGHHLGIAVGRNIL